ncbi:BNR repeat-containing protein [Rhizobium sp. SYY.PMSO]|uniref:BNR repeat-containing protein n=1 Tax=Rhizobium sp. SYY.PMSO TaxID=3382192 RepID=UPI00398FBB27
MIKSLCISALLAIMPVTSSMAADCSAATTTPVGNGKNGIVIDKAWSGTSVIFDAVARKQNVYFGYYDADRWLTVAELDTKSNTVCRVRLNSRYVGWDSHNMIALAFDGNGQLQVAGNMHSSPLVYGAAATSDSIADMALAPMIGRDEQRVTYPTFINGPDGKLYFTYRSGDSGNGEWVVNVRAGQKWKRTLNGPIFSSTWDGSPTNAYPSPFRIFTDGYAHIAAIWRRTSDVASNYAITYARTRDFIHWEDHNGKPITPPMDPGNSDMIEATGEGKGLVNAARVGITNSGTPVVAYTKYGPDGKNSILLASPDGNGWHHSIIATAEKKTVIAGGGSVPNLPSIGDPYVNSGSLGHIDVAFSGEKRKRIFFETNTLNVVNGPKPEAKPTAAVNSINVSPPLGLANVRTNSRSVRIDGESGKTAGSIIYFSQGVNRDRPRKCTSAQPAACDPPASPLIFVP